MNSTLHLKVIALILVVLGVGLTLYQILVLGTPLREEELADYWTIDARIRFNLPEPKAVDLAFQLPPKGYGYSIGNELFIAKGYGHRVHESGDERLSVWTARRMSGQQALYYRFNASRPPVEQPEPPGETWRAPIAVEGPDKIAVDALVEDIRQKSADTVSFISTAINKVNDSQDDNVRLLLGGDESPARRLRVLEVLLSQAHIPMQTVSTIRLSENGVQEPEAWARSYIEVTKEGSAGWYYFNLKSAHQGLPPDRLLWWVGDGPIVKAGHQLKPRVTLQVEKSALAARSLQQLTEGRDFSLYSLPLSTQFSHRLMLMIPFGVFIILVTRNIIGLETLGTFTPVLIALAFRETGLVFGAIFFSLIIFAGLILRAYLEQLKLQMLPRLSVVLSFVIILIVAGSMLTFKLGFMRGLAITLFPMVILTMAIERLSITWEERGGEHAFKVGLGTMVAASLVFVVLELDWLSYFVFTFPGVLLVLMAVMLGIGRYRGYRLSELFRFKALLSKGKGSGDA